MDSERSLTPFTPVPRAKHRHNGWSPATQRAFIAALAETGSVRAACRRVARSDNGAYQLRAHPEAQEFRAAWDAALDLGVRRIEDAAMDRALYGTEETVHYHGDLVATRRRYNERLVMFILRNRAPDRFTEGRPKALSAVDQMELKRLKQQWREEWERELDEDEQTTLDSIDRFIENMRVNREANLSPRARELYQAYLAQREADAAAGSYADYDDDDADEDDPTADAPAPAQPHPPALRKAAPPPPTPSPGTPRIVTVKGEWD